MKNKIFKKIWAFLAVFGLSSCAPGFFLCSKAYENVITSPSQALVLYQYLMNGDNNSMTTTATRITKSDNIFTLNFNDNDLVSSVGTGTKGLLDEPSSGEMYFAVFMDQKTGTNLAMHPLDKGTAHTISGNTYYEYSTAYEAPSNVDIVSVHIYKQQSSLPQFYPIKENFVGKLNFFTASNDIYLRQANNETLIKIKKYKKDGTEDDPSYQTSYYFNRLTPNLFTLYDSYVPTSQTIGPFIQKNDSIIVIEPVEGGGGQNMTQQDKVFPQTGFYQYMNNATVPISTKALPEDKYTTLYNLYLPDDLTRFYLKIYVNGSINDNNLEYQYYVDLNRA